ncbi:GAF domain-containing protein [uncultured Limimaricola sp.]|uniref:GAF domain-containing protein n=1 Tax=uncultured Limimaricola sp. TaxID=2211667 RepID=UPI0030FB6B9A
MSSELLHKGEELGELIRSHAWQSGPLGSPSGWTQELRNAVRVMLASSQPMWLFWGADPVLLYNDASRNFIGEQHPQAFGQPAPQGLGQAWTSIEPLLARIMQSGEAFSVEDCFLPQMRDGRMQETYHSIAFTPLGDEDGRTKGVLCAPVDVTRRVVEARQMALLKELTLRTTEVTDVRDACARVARALETGPVDVPFAALYLANGTALSLSATAGSVPHQFTAPDRMMFNGAVSCPVAEAFDTRTSRVVVLDQTADVSAAHSPAAVRQVLALPLGGSADTRPHGVLVIGLNPLGASDANGQAFLTLLATQIDAVIARTEAAQGGDAWQDGIRSLQHKMLELTLREEPLEMVLKELVEALRSFMGEELSCAILLTDHQRRHLHHGAAVGLPDSYIQAMDGIEIGPAAGSFGAAAFHGTAVHVADIAQDPLWSGIQDLALPHELRACWSNPIIGGNGDVLGVFAIYSPRVGLPSARDENFVELVSRTTALVLERYVSQKVLNDQKRLLETLNRTGAGVAAELDLEVVVQMVTDGGVELTGAQFGAFFYNVTDMAGDSYMLYALSGVERSAFSNFPMPRNTKVFSPTFGGSGIVRSDDITTDLRYGQNAPHKGMPKGHLPVRSYLAVPVVARSGEVIGGLFFGHAETGRFSEHHEQLMVGIAGQAAIAIDNARLYQAAQSEIEVRRRTEAELLKTKSELEVARERIELALAAGAIIGTWIWHVPTDLITADERFARAFDIDPERCHAGVGLSEVAKSVHPDDRDRVERQIKAAMRQGGDYRSEYRVKHAEGGYRWVEANGHCELDEQGNAVRFPGVLIDIEQRRRTETDLKRREADLALLLDATADGFYAVDTEGRTTRCNASFLRMLGFDSEEAVIGKLLHDVIHHSHADGTHYAHEDCPIYRVARMGDTAHVDHEVFFRTDGTSFPVEYWVRPVIWQGELQGAVCNIVDISERKRAEESRQLLLRELNHRVKNLFSITAGMIQMTARNARDVNEMSVALRGRLMSLARAHELITSSITARQDSGAPTRIDQLIDVIMEPHVSGREGALRQGGPDVDIGPTATTSLALILHELATNAAKYGALSTHKGVVAVDWTWSEAGLSLTWKETGGPHVVEAPRRGGFGSQLARLSATGQLGGSIDFDWHPEGVEIRLTAAADRLHY